jgi:hypothetical protein
MNLDILENYVNFSLISDINNKKKRSALDMRRLEHVLSSKGVTLGGIHYFTPEMSNGKVILEEQPCHIMNAQSFKRFIQLLTDQYSDEFNGVYECINDLIQQNPTEYRYLSNTGQYRDLSTKVNILPLICYYILKKYGEESEFWKIFSIAFYEYTQHIAKKAKGFNFSLCELLEWALKFNKLEYNEGLILGKHKEFLATTISLQWAAVDNWKFKLDLNINLDFSNSYISCIQNEWQVESEEFNDIYLDLVLFEMKANKIAHKECYEIALEDLSRIGDGLFETNKAPYSIFNQTENVTIYLNSEHNETNITDLAKRKQFLYDVSHSADFNYTLDESDLERLSRKLKPLEILDEIVVI